MHGLRGHVIEPSIEGPKGVWLTSLPPFFCPGDDLSKNTPFVMWAEIDHVEKAGPKSGRAIIQGVASTEAVDADGEVIVQKGIDWSWFMNHGFITLEHPVGIANIIGAPLKIKPTMVKGEKGTMLVAELFLDDPTGKQVFSKAQMLKKTKSDRKLGFSIEGRATKRNGNQIVESKVMSVAISPVPKNPYTFFEPLAASRNAMSQEDLMTMRLLKEMPALTWSQGRSVITNLKAKLGNRRKP